MRPATTWLRAALRGAGALLFALALLNLVQAADITVFAAASLSDALEEIGRKYRLATGDTVRFNFAASSMLERQIEEGAPADVFFSADAAKMDALARQKRILPETRRSLLSNSLVIVVNAVRGAQIARPSDLASLAVQRLALAEPTTVPAGIYAKAFLLKAGLWERVAARVVPTENVRACLAAVESGNVDAGIVYRTDAFASKRVRVAFEVPRGDAPAISYPVAVVRGSRSAEAARRFVAYLASADAGAVFEKCGFLPPGRTETTQAAVRHRASKAVEAVARCPWADAASSCGGNDEGAGGVLVSRLVSDVG